MAQTRYLFSEKNWNYDTISNYWKPFGICFAICQIVFFFALKDLFQMEEFLSIRAASSVLLLGFVFLPKEKLTILQKLYVELTAVISLPLMVSILSYANPNVPYWVASGIFFGFAYGFLAYLPFALCSYSLIFASILLLPDNGDMNGYSLTFLGGGISVFVGSVIHVMFKKSLNLATENRLTMAHNKVLTEQYEKLLTRENVIKSFVNPSILQEIEQGNDPTRFEPEVREVYILFADMIGYSENTEHLESKEDYQKWLETLNLYLSEIIDSTYYHGGEVDKIIADQGMCYFHSAESAYEALMEMRMGFSRLNRRMVEEGKKPAKFGTGLDVGTVLYGNLGNFMRLDRSFIGDCADVASRLEGQTRKFRVDILVTQAFIEKLSGINEYRPIYHIKVKGKMKEVVAYELFGHNKQSVIDWKIASRDALDEVLQRVQKNEFDAALDQLDSLIDKCPKHGYIQNEIMDPTLMQIRKHIELDKSIFNRAIASDSSISEDNPNSA